MIVNNQIIKTKEDQMDYDKILNEAHQAGWKAGTKKVPTPMMVVQRENPLDDKSDVVQAWNVPSGICGFASVVTTAHGNSKFVKHLKKVGEGRKQYYGGYCAKRVREFGQSYEQKVAYAHAFADVLKKYDIEAYVEDRLD